MNARLWVLLAGWMMVAPATVAQNRLPAEIREKLRRSTAYIITKNQERGGTGTGFVIKTEGKTAYIATNNHVIDPNHKGEEVEEKRTRLKVVFDSEKGDPKPLPAELLAGDKEHDLAILRVDMETAPPKAFDLYSQQGLAETLPVTVFGFPLGDPDITINTGEVSGFRHDDLGHMERVKLFTKVDPGNSGGPVVDNQGAIVGVTVEKDRRADNIGYAIPAFELHQLLRGKLGNFDSKQQSDGAKFTIKITADVLDPFKKLERVVVHSIAKKALSANALKKAVSKNGAAWKLLSNKMDKTEVKISEPKVTLEFQAEGESGDSLYAQLEYHRDGEDSWISNPMELFLGGRVREPEETTGRKIPLPVGEPLALAGEKKSARGIEATELTVNAAEVLPTMLWDREHLLLYVVETNGKVRKIDVRLQQQDAHLDLGFACQACALSGEGLVVLAQDKAELWVIDRGSLEVKRVIDVPDVAHVASAQPSFYGFAVNQAGDAILAYDLHDATVSQTLKLADLKKPAKVADGGEALKKFGPVRMTPDGRFLFTASGGALHRFGVKDEFLTYEEAGPVIAPESEQIELSTDSGYVAMPTRAGNKMLAGYTFRENGFYLFDTANLAKPKIILDPGQPTPQVGIDAATGKIYGTFKNAPLAIFGMDGGKLRDFPELEGEYARQLLPYHRARGVLLVLTEKKLYLVRSTVK